MHFWKFLTKPNRAAAVSPILFILTPVLWILHACHFQRKSKKNKTAKTSQSDTSMPMNHFSSIDRNQKDKIVTSHSFSNNSKLSNVDSRDSQHKKTEMFIFSNACHHCTTKQTSFSFECGFLQERKLSYWCRPSTPWPLRRKSWLPCARNMQIW